MMSSMQLAAPLFQLIRTGEANYLYDTATNTVLRVGSEAAAFLQKEEFSGADLLRLLDYSRRNAGTLRPCRPRRFSSPFSSNDIAQAIGSGCSQATLEVSRKCNLRCDYCVYSGQYAGKRTHEGARMPHEVAFRAIEYLATHSVRAPLTAIGFYGGEPLTNFVLIQDATSYASKLFLGRRIQFTLTTNGTLLSDDIMEFLEKHKFGLMVSIDGPQDIHDENRVYANNRGSWSDTVDNLRRLKSRYPDYWRTYVNLSMVVSPGTDLLELDRFVREEDIASVKLATISSYGTQYREQYEKQPIVNEEAILKRYADAGCAGQLNVRSGTPELCLACSLCGTSMSRLIQRSPGVDAEKESTLNLGMCVPGARKIFVDVDGDIYPCEKTDGARNLYLGNVLTGGVQLEKVEAILQDFFSFVEESCKDCWMHRFCETCLVQPTWKHTFDADKMAYECDALRRKYKKMLELYCGMMEVNPRALDHLMEDRIRLSVLGTEDI